MIRHIFVRILPGNSRKYEELLGQPANRVRARTCHSLWFSVRLLIQDKLIFVVDGWSFDSPNRRGRMSRTISSHELGRPKFQIIIFHLLFAFSRLAFLWRELQSTLAYCP